MKRFSIGESIGDAFRLIRRRPLAVLVWGLLVLAPAFGAMALVFPMLGEMMASASADGSVTAAETMMSNPMVEQMMQMQLASMLMNVGQLLAMAMVYTAIMRAVVRPTETSFFSLRIGLDELRVAVAGLAIMIGLYIAILAAAVVMGAVGFILWQISGSWAPILIVVMIGAVVVSLCWGLARLSLIAPASVLRRDFAFGEGWNLAAGKAWPLLGMMVLLCLIILAIEAIAVLIGVAVFTGVAASGDGAWLETAANPFPAMQDWAAANWYWLVPAGVVASLLYGVVITLGVAPFASACRQLADSSRPAPEPQVAPADGVGSPA